MKSKQLDRLVKKLGLSIVMFFAIPTALVEAEARPAFSRVSRPSYMRASSLFAQIAPDESLPTSVEQLQEIMKINGGERAGSNLFHSFDEFSIPEGMEAVFENAVDIENIFTRITGESISNIEGVLRTQGDANFFLVNPNGIVFGENARLDVGGSFIATTANSIQFEGGTEFAANDSATEPIITIERPIGLNFNGNSGAIEVNGNGSQIEPSSTFSPTSVEDTKTGLSVTSGNTLALVGGNINVSGGSLSANSGRVKLGSVDAGTVSLSSIQNGWNLDYQDVSNFKNIQLSKQALVDASGEGSSYIQVDGNNVSIIDGSLVLIQNSDNTTSGNIEINALESLLVKGTTAEGTIAGGLRTEALGAGKGSDLQVSSRNLMFQSGGEIGAVTYGTARGGDIDVNVSESIQMLGTSSVSPFLNSGIVATTYADGDTGKIELSATQLKAVDGGGAISFSLGAGAGNDVTVNADSIELIGTAANSSTPTALGITAANKGNAGSLTVNTSNLKLIDGGTVTTSSISNGSAGNVTVNATESIEVSGQKNNFPSTISSAVVTTTSESARERLEILEAPNASSGNVTIDTPFLNVNQGGLVSVRNRSLGQAGTLSVNAELINLEEYGSIAATSVSGHGGNINLKTDQLQLDENSSITATAENDGDGGNININTTSLLAKKNSEITANAFAGTGGNIQIDTKGLFLFPDSTIEASSELGIDGTVRIDTLDTNLQKDLEASELNLITSENSLANSCLVRRNSQQGSFTINNGNSLSTTGGSDFYDSGSITGIDGRKRSGLPTMFHSRRDNSFSTVEVEQAPVIEFESSNSMIPAQQAVKTEDGRIFLVAAPQSVKSLFCN